MHSDTYFIIIAIISVCGVLAMLSVIKHYSKRYLIPSDTWVLIAGLLYGIGLKKFGLDNFPRFELHPQVIILVFLPLLIFVSGRLIKPGGLKSEVVPISFFATIGVVITAFLIGAPLAWVLDIPLLQGLLIGAAAGATDPAAVASIFHNFRIPERLGLIVEGESLFNDGTTVVFFGLISGLVFGGKVFDLGGSLATFFWAISAALPLGIVFGRLAAALLNRWQERHISYDLSITLVMIYIVFLIAEELLHVSGVIAVLMASITFCRYRVREKNPDTKAEPKSNNIDDFWDYMAMIANGILFFSLGVTTGLHDFSEVPSIAIIIAVASMVFARCLVVYGGSFLLNGVRSQLSIQWQHVLVLGGLRGAISAALILMIPQSYPYRGAFLCLIVSMIVFTLVVQPVLLRVYLKKNDI